MKRCFAPPSPRGSGFPRARSRTGAASLDCRCPDAVRFLVTRDVADTVIDSGRHNTSRRAGRDITEPTAEIEFTLTYYSQFVACILVARPVLGVRVEL